MSFLSGILSKFYALKMEYQKNHKVEDSQLIRITGENSGAVHLFDIITPVAKNWNKGSIYWHFETDIDYCCMVNKGDTIGIIRLTYYKRTKDTLTKVKEETLPIIVSINGIVKFNDYLLYKEKYGNLSMNEPSFIEKNRNISTYNPNLFLFFDSTDNLVKTEIPYTIEVDPITRDYFIKGFDEGNTLKPNILKAWRLITYNFEGGQNQALLVLHLTPYKVALRKIKDIVLLFDSTETLIFSIDKRMTSCKNDRMDTKIKLAKEQIDLLSTKTIQLIRYLQDNGDFADLPIETAYAEYFRAYSARFAKALEACGWNAEEQASLNSTEDGISKNNLKDSVCYVYLMYDESNGYYKIENSNHPKYREHTLQSEKPTIVLLKAKQFPIRSIAEAYEAALHKTYANKRLRGEWFNLDEQDVENLKIALQ